MDNIVQVFDKAMRLRLAETIKAVISQRLIRRKDKAGRIAVIEIMRATRSIQECIEIPEKTGGIKDHLATGREHYGMQTFDQHLMDLFQAGIISLETAKSAATSPADFERNLKFV